MKNITIIADYAGTGKEYRKVYKVYNGNKYLCRFSKLESAQAAYPRANFIDL